MVDWSTSALIFPGQGSQQVGMGADLIQNYRAADDVFRQADDILGYSLSKLCFEGPAGELDQTTNTQPALYVMGMAIFRVLESLHGDRLKPMVMAGHSLGEFTALTAAGALTFEEGVKLVQERARLMAEAGKKHPGAMAALLGLDAQDVYEICDAATQQIGKPVVLANDNCPGQVVISGDEEALDCALSIAKERGAKRAIKLAVSVAAHSPLMAHASETFRELLQAIPFEKPRVPVIGNVSAAQLTDRDSILEELDAQLTSSVLWTESVQAMRTLGASTFLELGPKDVLTGLLKRIDKGATGIPLNSAVAIEALSKEGV